MNEYSQLLKLGVLVACALTFQVAKAQHSDVLLQRQGNQIVVGSANFDQFSWTIGARVFARDFDSDYIIENPGYNALSNSSPFLPPGYSALPASSAVYWDFLPMKVECLTSNLFYWAGQDTNGNGTDVADVAFGTLLGYTLMLNGIGGVAAADGSAQMVPGSILAQTDSSGAMHYHRPYTLDDGDLNPETNPVDGIYLVALQARMDTLETSAPFFLVFGTPGSTLAARNAAVSWVQQRIDTLTDVGLPGDYNCDGVVDAADYIVWRKTLGDPVRYAALKENFATSSEAAASSHAASAPEPSLSGLMIWSVASGLALSRRRALTLRPAVR